MMKKLNNWFEISEKDYMWYILQGYEIIDEQGDGVTWQLDDVPHREDGPAYIGVNGTRIYHIHGNIHRIDGPAVEGANGTREWWLYGSRHRTDGPAIEYTDGTCEWWINSIKITETEFNERITNENKRNTVD